MASRGPLSRTCDRAGSVSIIPSSMATERAVRVREETAASTRNGLYAGLPKRALDLLGALLLTPGALVICGLAALAIKLTSPGPVLYRQRRIGRGGREFCFPKLRTMVNDAERDCGPVWAPPDDPRVTPVGAFLRRYRLDELPQLWCVLRGEMSLIGPRPERPHFVHRLREQLPHYDERLAVRPGITGWAQIHRPSDTCVADAAEKLRYDREYVRALSLALDLRILLATPRVALLDRYAR